MILIGLLSFLYFSINIYLIGNNEIELGYKQKYFENGYVVKMFGREISNIEFMRSSSVLTDV